MIKTSIVLLGAGLLVAGVAAPPAANANDETLAFIVGAAVGHAISDRDTHVLHVHRRYHGHDSRSHYFDPYSGRVGHHAFHRQWHREHQRFHGHDRYDDTRHHRRHDRRHDRRDDRRDHRRDGRHHG